MRGPTVGTVLVFALAATLACGGTETFEFESSPTDVNAASDTGVSSDTILSDSALTGGDSGTFDAPADTAGNDSGMATDAPIADTSTSDMLQDLALVDVADTSANTNEDMSLDAATDQGTPEACNANGNTGVCLHVDDCSATSVAGFCPGPAEIQCCISVSSGTACAVGGVSGNCLLPDACDGDRTASVGFCPWPTDNHCCSTGVADEPICDPDVYPQPNAGNTTEAAGIGGCPDGMTLVSDVCVDVYEGSLLAWDGDAWVSWSPYHSPGDRDLIALSVAGAVPQGFISGEQAQRACRGADKRLCTSDEWLDACRGTDRTRLYPYGAHVAGRCNETYDGHPAISYFGNQTWVFSEIDHPCIPQQPDTYALTGSYSECITPEGVFDMVGNVHEWINDVPDGSAPTERTAVDFRGGFFADTTINNPGCTYRTLAHFYGHSDYSTGFRCCAEPLE